MASRTTSKNINLRKAVQKWCSKKDIYISKGKHEFFFMNYVKGEGWRDFKEFDCQISKVGLPFKMPHAKLYFTLPHKNPKTIDNLTVQEIGKKTTESFLVDILEMPKHLAKLKGLQSISTVPAESLSEQAQSALKQSGYTLENDVYKLYLE